MANITNPYVPKPVYETCVTRIIGEHKCLWYSNYRPDVHKMEKLMESNPDDVKIVLDYRNETGEAYGLQVKVPEKWFKSPSRPKQMSEEHKVKMREKNNGKGAEALKKWREEQKKNKVAQST